MNRSILLMEMDDHWQTITGFLVQGQESETQLLQLSVRSLRVRQAFFISLETGQDEDQTLTFLLPSLLYSIYAMGLTAYVIGHKTYIYIYQFDTMWYFHVVNGLQLTFLISLALPIKQYITFSLNTVKRYICKG